MTPHKYPFDWAEFHAWKRSQQEKINPRPIKWIFERRVMEILK